MLNNLIHIPHYIENDEELYVAIRDNVKWEFVPRFHRYVVRYNWNSEADKLKMDMVNDIGVSINALNTVLIDNGTRIEELDSIIRQLQVFTNENITGAFLNYYPNGDHYATWHNDQYNCDCILISLGTMRTLRYKHNFNGSTKDFMTKTGDLLFIPNDINKDYKHSLLKVDRSVGPRISILLFLES